MKKLLSLLLSTAVLMTSFLGGVASAATIYVPTDESDQYLPTVKIFSYTLSYDGSLLGEAYGSGTLIDNQGTILTNNHVIENYYDPSKPNDAFQVCLTKSNNPEEPICEFTASLIARDPDKDVAILKMDSTDVTGDKVAFDFFLDYDNESAYNIGETVTVIGYPDTGGRTITYTSGLISGFLTEGGVKYVKTDADISFGNSGGTAVAEDGNFIGIPTYIVGSYSSEVLGYLLPIESIVEWISDNKSVGIVKNEAADAALKDAMLANINANKKGVFKNDYPPYSISLIDGWKFGNSLEGAFDGNGYGSYYGSQDVVIYPVELSDSSQLYVEVSVTDYAYNVTLDDIEYILDSYSSGDYQSYNYNGYSETPVEEGEGTGYERVKLNDGYDAVKEVYSYYDWWYDTTTTTVTYYIPYGDKVINVLYGYGDNDLNRVGEAEEMVASFEVDMDAIESKVENVVASEEPKITVKNPFDDIYLSDDSYQYEDIYYFVASFGKKKDYDFYVSIYSNQYWDEKYVGNFAEFKKDTLADADEWYEIVAKGELTIDGHKGFFYTDQYDSGYGDSSMYTTLYIEGDDNTYYSSYYSGSEESYSANLDEFKLILENIELSNDGKGKYLIPSFSTSSAITGVLSDIKNYIYEDNIRNLNSKGAFGEKAPFKFNPADSLTRGEYLKWVVLSLQGATAGDFADFEAAYSGCGEVCFADVESTSEIAKYVDYAYSKGAIGGLGTDGKRYFSPDSPISLMAALKIIFEIYDYGIWEAPSFVPWYIPYLQLGYKEGVIPYGVADEGYLLTRGEGAYIIDGVSASYYYGDYYYDDFYSY